MDDKNETLPNAGAFFNANPKYSPSSLAESKSAVYALNL
jgi:hypothetical protein